MYSLTGHDTESIATMDMASVSGKIKFHTAEALPLKTNQQGPVLSVAASPLVSKLRLFNANVNEGRSDGDPCVPGSRRRRRRRRRLRSPFGETPSPRRNELKLTL
ncbi:hypothetical protein MHYP_G00330760 [Metynnis hypsauchen]